MVALYEKKTNKKLAALDDIIIENSISITRQINGEFTLKLEALEADLKSQYFQGETYVAANGYYFDLVYIEQQHSDTLTYQLEGEHVSYRLISYDVPYYTFDGTPEEILTDILSGTELMPGAVDNTDIIIFAVYEETNRLGLVQLLAGMIHAEIDFDGFKIDLKNTIGQDRGFTARFGRNVTGLKKIMDKRNDLTCYSVDIIELKNHPDYAGFENLETIEEGDTIRIVDEVLGLDVVNKVIKRTYNPIKAINTSLEIANRIDLFTDTVTKIKRDTVIKDKLYHGIRISPDLGFESIRNDNMARGIFNSDTFALQSGDGTGGNWINKLYFDPIAAKYIFDGDLSADTITALQSLITPNLYAEKANIAELTVDELQTHDKIAKYLAEDITDVNYIRIYDQWLQFITATTDGMETEYVYNRDGGQLYWEDDTFKNPTTEATEYPITIYKYTELIKRQIGFEMRDGLYTPAEIVGLGSYPEEHPDWGKTYIYKSAFGYEINYYDSQDGTLRQIKLSDDGVFITPYDLEQLDFYSTGFSAKYSGITYAWTWTKDGSGKITSLTTDDNVSIPVTWH